ncbi:MAG: hypothetical protein AAB393_05510 [Bacteroidota bacterium]
MRTLAFSVLMASVTSVGLARAEVAGEMHPSPDKKHELRVVRTSEAPDLTIRLLQDKKAVWSQNLGSSPADNVLVWWHPHSVALLVQHVTTNKECRLLVVRLDAGAIQSSALPSEELRNVTSVVADTVTWDKDGSIRFKAETTTGRRALHIVGSCHLVSGEDQEGRRTANHVPEDTARNLADTQH